jgi:hypothetical protein
LPALSGSLHWLGLQAPDENRMITASSSRAMSVAAAEETVRILRGERPLNLVNPGYKAR